MGKGDPLAARKSPANLLVVALLWAVGVPVMVGACVGLYKAATAPPDDPWLLALIVGGSLVYLVIWPAMLYRATAARRRGQPLWWW